MRVLTEIVVLVDAVAPNGVNAGLILEFHEAKKYADSGDPSLFFTFAEDIKRALPHIITKLTFAEMVRSAPEKPYVHHNMQGAALNSDKSLNLPKGKRWMKLIMSIDMTGEEE